MLSIHRMFLLIESHRRLKSFLGNEKLKKYFFSGTRWLHWLYRLFSASALLIDVKFLLSVSSSSKAVERHHCQAVLLHICTITQAMELRFFKVSRLSAAELEAQPWLGWGITTFWNSWFSIREGSACSCGFEDVIAEKTSHVPVHGILGIWPWVCCLTPTKIYYKQFFFFMESFMLMIVQDKCSVFFKLSDCQKFPVWGLWFYNQLCHRT